MNAFIAPLERAVLNLAHGETDAEIKGSQRDRAVKGRPCRRQSRNQDPHSPCSCWDRVPKPGAPSPPPPAATLSEAGTGRVWRTGTMGTTHRPAAPLRPGPEELEPPGDSLPASTSPAFPPPHPRELEPGCLRGQASDSPGQLRLLGMSPGQVAHSYPPESEQPERRLSQSWGSCGGCCSRESPGGSPGPRSLLTAPLFFSLLVALALRQQDFPIIQES